MEMCKEMKKPKKNPLKVSDVGSFLCSFSSWGVFSLTQRIKVLRLSKVDGKKLRKSTFAHSLIGREMKFDFFPSF